MDFCPRFFEVLLVLCFFLFLLTDFLVEEEAVFEVLLGFAVFLGGVAARAEIVESQSSPHNSAAEQRRIGEFVCIQKTTGEGGLPYVPRSGEEAPVSPVNITVTEVYRPGKSFRPEPAHLLGGQGTRCPARSWHPTRSSKSPRANLRSAC